MQKKTFFFLLKKIFFERKQKKVNWVLFRGLKETMAGCSKTFFTRKNTIDAVNAFPS